MKLTAQKGDLVRAIKGERVVIDRVEEDPDGDLYLAGAGYFTMGDDREHVPLEGYEWKILEKDPTSLPTKAGFYQCEDGVGCIYFLTVGGVWVEHYGYYAEVVSEDYVQTWAHDLIEIPGRVYS